VNWSAALPAEVPDGVVTVTVTAPGGWGGATTVRVLGPVTVTLDADRVPKLTVAVEVNPLPLRTTSVFPPTVPVEGEMPVTTGGARLV
jgi:hypothetical protein